MGHRGRLREWHSRRATEIGKILCAHPVADMNCSRTRKLAISKQRTNMLSRSCLTVFSGVCSLFFPSRPAAVSRFVVSIVVDAVERVAIRRFRSHIRKKVRKCTPTIANRDAPTAVILPVPRAGIGASLNHSIPSTVFRPTLSAFVSAMYHPWHSTILSWRKNY